MIKIAYIIVNEDLNSPLLIRQVVELLGEIKSKKPNELYIRIFLFQGLLSLFRNDLKEVKEKLNSFGVKLTIVPNICPWPVPNLFKFRKTDVGWRQDATWYRFAASLFPVLALPLMLLLRLVLKYKIFHCRSYPATSTAIFLKKIIPSTCVIFDPRSDFPEENVTSEIWQENSKDFLYWKKAEKRFLEQSDSVALIGPTYLRHYRKSSASFNYFFVPNNVKTSFFSRKEESRVRIRKELGIDSNEEVYIYLGGMSKKGWHRPEFYVRFYDQLKTIKKKFKILFLIPNYSVDFTKESFGERENIILISPSFSEVSEYLSAADFGLMLFHTSTIRIGTKIGEYLSASLPVIVNKNCIGAVDLINNHPELGHIIGLNLGGLDGDIDMNSIRMKENVNYDLISNFAFNYFDNSIIANRYISKYCELAE